MANGTGTPCGACKFLRRKCAVDCIFAPYFCSDQGPARFAAIHKVFGASNLSKLLLHVPVADRSEAVVTIAYEAQARIHDPVYGCVAHIFSLQQQVAYLQSQLMQARGQLAQNMIESSKNQWTNSANNSAGFASSLMPMATNFPTTNYANSFSPNSSISSLESLGPVGAGAGAGAGSMLEMMREKEEMISLQAYSRKRSSQTDLTELQALAHRMMKH